jgi:predicted transposase/invertase (TIGR01784 family)
MEEYRRNVMDYADVRDCVTCARDEGFEEGINQSRLEIAKSLLDLRLPITDIAKATGLTPEQLIEIM